MELRPYQREAVDAIEKEWQSGHTKTLLSACTGSGKTIIMSSVISNQVNQGARAMILAHRGELLDQAADKLYKSTGIQSALEKAGSTAMGSFFPVTVASQQSMSQDKRLERFPPDYYDVIVVDEAHHIMSDSYQKIMSHFFSAYVLGVTATPDRGDRKNLGQYFDSIAYDYPMVRAVREGYLCPIKAQMVPLDIDLNSVKISNGDYSAGDVGNALDPYLYQIAEEMKKYCIDRKVVVFLPLIATSQKFRDILIDAGFTASEVNGNSPDRAEILQDFHDGKFQILCNSMLLTEGWDEPAVDCIINLRPTKIRSLYQQIIGRGTRLFPGKKDLLILDFLWQTARMDLCRPSSLVAKDEKQRQRIDEIVEQGEQLDLLDADKQATKDAIEERENALKEELAAQRKKKGKLVDPLQYCMSIADEDLADYVPEFAWQMAPASDKQLQLIEKFGVATNTVQNAGYASELIDRLINRQKSGLATPKQIRCLERYGFRNVGQWNFTTAKNLIGRIAQLHWKIPYGFDAASWIPKELQV